MMIGTKTRSTIGISLGTAALVLALAASAAANGRVAIVNGIPGRTVEICVNGKEIKSGLKYGHVVVRGLGNGDKSLRIRASKPGKCSGAILGRLGFSVADGTDLTIAGTRFGPQKVLLWENTDNPPPGVGMVMLRHAADVGTVGFKYSLPDGGTPWTDSVDDPWTKGARGWGLRPDGVLMIWWAHQPPVQRVVAGPYQLVVEGGNRHESVLVGSNLGNLRFVRFKVPTGPA